MPPICLFCENPAGSQEHLWPAWIHARKKFGPIRHKIGAGEAKILQNAEQKVGTVCGTCNNGWMSALESDNIPIIGSMLNDLTITLDEQQQGLVSAWAVKTSMVVDSVQGRDPAKRFYRKPECEAMRLARTVPDRSRIWIGRSISSALTAAGTHVRVFSPEIPARTPAMIVTIVVGHLAIQVFTMHVHPEHADLNIPDPNPAPGEWDNLLIPIWPITLQYVMWPPKETFTRGSHNAIGTLTNRWRMGQEVPYELLRRG